MSHEYSQHLSVRSSENSVNSPASITTNPSVNTMLAEGWKKEEVEALGLMGIDIFSIISLNCIPAFKTIVQFILSCKDDEKGYSQQEKKEKILELKERYTKELARNHENRPIKPLYPDNKSFKSTSFVAPFSREFFEEILSAFSASARIVFMELYFHAPRKGQEDHEWLGGIYPAVRTLARKLRLSTNTVLRAQKELEAGGLARKIKREGQSNFYQIRRPFPSVSISETNQDIQDYSLNISYPDYPIVMQNSTSRSGQDKKKNKRKREESSRGGNLCSIQQCLYALELVPPANESREKEANPESSPLMSLDRSQIDAGKRELTKTHSLPEFEAYLKDELPGINIKSALKAIVQNSWSIEEIQTLVNFKRTDPSVRSLVSLIIKRLQSGQRLHSWEAEHMQKLAEKQAQELAKKQREQQKQAEKARLAQALAEKERKIRQEAHEIQRFIQSLGEQELSELKNRAIFTLTSQGIPQRCILRQALEYRMKQVYDMEKQGMDFDSILSSFPAKPPNVKPQQVNTTQSQPPLTEAISKSPSIAQDKQEVPSAPAKITNDPLLAKIIGLKNVIPQHDAASAIKSVEEIVTHYQNGQEVSPKLTSLLDYLRSAIDVFTGNERTRIKMAIGIVLSITKQLTSVDGTTKAQTINVMNEYDSFAATPQTHDDNGNLTNNGSFLFTYDFANRIVEVRKQDNTLVATYSYDAFNRRISKTLFKEEGTNEGEYQSDSNTLALYHFNESSGKVIDSSGNNNNGIPPILIKRGIEGLWNTKAVEFKGLPITVPGSPSLNNLTNKLTVETWVYLKAPECNDKKHKPFWKPYPCKKHPFFCPLCWKNLEDRSLINRPAMYQLQIDEQTKKAEFTLFIQETSWPHRTRKLSISSNEAVPLDDWVHLAGVYDGTRLILYVDGVKQTDQEVATGNIKRLPIPLFLGGLGFRGRMEEARISNTARTEFGGGGTVTRLTLRSFYYIGWREVEEREQTGSLGQPMSQERIVRQFVDGRGIDEHLAMDVFRQDGSGIEKTLYYHENARGDTVAMSDASGNVVLRLAYSAYGEVYKINENGQLEPFTDYESVVYCFQGRRFDQETGMYYFRWRYYDPVQGRFASRDPIGYAGGGMGLYEAFSGSPGTLTDPLGDKIRFQGQNVPQMNQLKNDLEKKSGLKLDWKPIGPDEWELKIVGEEEDGQISCFLREHLKEAIKGDKIINIQNTTGESEFRGGIAYLNFTEIDQYNYKGESIAFLFTHEALFHGYYGNVAEQGKYTTSSEGKPVFLTSATDFENVIREELGLPLRIIYMTDPNNLGPGSSSGMVFSDNTILYPQHHGNPASQATLTQSQSQNLFITRPSDVPLHLYNPANSPIYSLYYEWTLLEIYTQFSSSQQSVILPSWIAEEMIK